MKKNISFLILVFSLIAGTLYYFQYLKTPKTTQTASSGLEEGSDDVDQGGPQKGLHPLSIASLRSEDYPGSDIIIEQTLSPGSNYNRYIASYKSEGLKIYALLTVPNGSPPSGGWPVVIFNHGYISPAQYVTTQKYVAYTDGFSRSGYIVFRSDYRGHGNSEGTPSGAYGSSGYTIDILNALASLKKYPAADPQRIGMWGHSMGGHITLRAMVVSKDIKAGVIWSGVVASYPDLLHNWRRRTPTSSPNPTASVSRGWRQSLVNEYGEPQSNPLFWNSISANSFLADISGPIQLHHGTADHSVPVEFSQKLADQLQNAGQVVELYTYPGDDHDITANLTTAMERSIAFFDKYLKN